MRRVVRYYCAIFSMRATEQGERPMAEQNKKQSDQQSGQADQDRNQPKSETQRRAEEAARRDKPKGDASSVGTVGT